MFYLTELFFRFQYFIVSFLLTVLIAYLFKDILFILLTFPLINNSNTLNSFIYTHPAELLTIHLLLMVLIAFIFQIPYFFWHFVDFIKTSLIKKEYKNLTKVLFVCVFSLILFNFFFFFIIFPKFWFFFYNFNFSFNNPQTLNFFLELRVQEYFDFVLTFIYSVNLFILIFFLLFIFFLFLGFEKLLYWKKLFLFVNIVFATLLSPPDVYSQLSILFVLTLFLEIIVFCNLYFYKSQKMIVFNKA
jgi:sec-independent protein translocase protein TatC